MNREIQIPEPEKPGKILKSENFDLEIMSLNNGVFLLTGRQKLRYVDAKGQAIDENAFFFQELKVTDF